VSVGFLSTTAVKSPPYPQPTSQKTLEPLLEQLQLICCPPARGPCLPGIYLRRQAFHSKQQFDLSQRGSIRPPVMSVPVSNGVGKSPPKHTIFPRSTDDSLTIAFTSFKTIASDSSSWIPDWPVAHSSERCLLLESGLRLKDWDLKLCLCQHRFSNHWWLLYHACVSHYVIRTYLRQERAWNIGYIFTVGDTAPLTPATASEWKGLAIIVHMYQLLWRDSYN